MFGYKITREKKESKVECHKCGKHVPESKITKLTWRYQDKTGKKYTSGRTWTHTGYTYLCPKCLKEYTT